ncbi:MAG: mercury transporter MerT [Proteobacteria bacterium]|nr:MAG: mercury transporter MerT [Pseudomonadota bacterium]
MNEQVNQKPAWSGMLTALGLVTGFGALALASCCALPLALAIIGLSGSWLAGLGGLLAYQPYLLAVAAVAVGAGWFVALRRRVSCEPGRGCARPTAGWATFSALGLSTLFVALAASWGRFEPALMSFLLDVWRAA